MSCAVRGRAVADQLGVNFRAARLCVFQFFENQHAAAARDDETVAILVEGARGAFRRLVVARRHRAHRVEQYRQRPVEFFAAAGENDVLLAPLDEFAGIADAMRARRAGRSDRIVHALDLEPGGKHGRTGRRHRLGDDEGSDALWALHGFAFSRCRPRLRSLLVDGPPEPMTRPVRGLTMSFSSSPRIGDGLFHGKKIVRRAVAHEAACTPVDGRIRCRFSGCRGPDSESPFRDRRRRR